MFEKQGGWAIEDNDRFEPIPGWELRTSFYTGGNSRCEIWEESQAGPLTENIILDIEHI